MTAEKFKLQLKSTEIKEMFDELQNSNLSMEKWLYY